eukprot:7379204-Prymnesium_polylepis.1
MYWAQGEHSLYLKSFEQPDNASLSAYGTSTYGKYRTGYRCLMGWRRLNPSWDVRLLNDAEAIRLSPAFSRLADRGVGKTQLWSDVLRLDLLARYGGVWADVSTCPVHTLEEWLPNYVAPTGFFSFWWKYDPVVLRRELNCENAVTDPRDGNLGHTWGGARRP